MAFSLQIHCTHFEHASCPCARHEVIWGSWLRLTCTSTHSYRCSTRTVQLHTPTALLLGKSHQYRINRRQGGPLNRSAGFGEDKNLVLQSKFVLEPRFFGSPIRSLVLIPTELSRPWFFEQRVHNYYVGFIA
jgi:hypothetical protein